MNTTHMPAPVEAGAFTGFWCPGHGRYCLASGGGVTPHQVPADPYWMWVLSWLSDRFVR